MTPERPRTQTGRSEAHARAGILVVGAAWVMLSVAGAAQARGLSSETIPEVVPPAFRPEVRAVVTDPTFVRSLDLEAVADPRLFAHLLDHPDLMAALGRDLSLTRTRLVRLGPDRYQGQDAAGNAGTLDVLWGDGAQRVLLERGVSPGWWFGNISGRVVALVALSTEGDLTRGHVTVWARIDEGLMDRVLRFLTPVLGGFLDRKLQEQFGLTFRVAARAAREPERFCNALTGLAEGSPRARRRVAELVGCRDNWREEPAGPAAAGAAPPSRRPAPGPRRDVPGA